MVHFLKHHKWHSSSWLYTHDIQWQTKIYNAQYQFPFIPTTYTRGNTNVCLYLSVNFTLLSQLWVNKCSCTINVYQSIRETLTIGRFVCSLVLREIFTITYKYGRLQDNACFLVVLMFMKIFHLFKRPYISY